MENGFGVAGGDRQLGMGSVTQTGGMVGGFLNTRGMRDVMRLCIDYVGKKGSSLPPSIYQIFTHFHSRADSASGLRT